MQLNFQAFTKSSVSLEGKLPLDTGSKVSEASVRAKEEASSRVSQALKEAPRMRYTKCRIIPVVWLVVGLFALGQRLSGTALRMREK